MKLLTVLLFCASALLGADPQVTVFKIPSRWISTVIPSPRFVHDSVQVWIDTQQPEIEAFKVTISFEFGGKQSRLEAVVIRNYSGPSVHSFSIPTVDIPVQVDVKAMVSQPETYSIRVD